MVGQSTLGIGLTLFLRDQFSGPAAKIRSSSAAMQQDIQKLQEEELRHARNLNAGLALASAGVLRQFGRVVKKASEFGYEMEFVKTITRSTREETQALSKIAMDLGQATMFTGKQVASGMRYMAMAGYSSEEIAKNIKGAVYLAASTMSDIEGVGGSADIMTSIMRQFQVPMEKTMAVADILSYATTRAKTSLSDLGEALKYSGSTAMDLKIPLQEATGMIMALSNAGLRGSMGGVAAENAMRYMAMAAGSFGTGRQEKALSMLGLSKEDLLDSSGNLKSMIGIIKTVGSALEQLDAGTAEGQGILQALFGVRGKRAGSLFIRDLKNFDQMVQELSTKSQGHAQKVSLGVMETVRGYIDRIGSALENLGIKFVEKLEPTLKWVMGAAEWLIMKIQAIIEIPWVGDWLSHLAIGFVTFKGIIWAYRSILAGINLLHIQSARSAAVLSATGITGYTRMTSAASNYARVQAATTATAVAGWNAQTAAALRTAAAARVAGQTSGWSQVANMTAARRIIGQMNGALGVTAGGTFFRKTAGKTGKAGRFVSGAAAMRYASLYGGRAVTTVGATTGILARAVSFLGGPWSIALAFVLPSLLGILSKAISGNKDAVDKNTEALDKKNAEERAGMIYQHEFDMASVGPRMVALQAMGNTQITGEQLGVDFNKTISESLAKLIGNMGGNSGDIIINLDGETIYRKPIDSLKKDFKSLGLY